MDVFQVVLFISVLAGIGLVLYALFMLQYENKGGSTSYLEVDNTIKAIDTSIDEADRALEELDKISKGMLAEADEKYQELLFLYSLIDEKKKEVMTLYSRSSAPATAAETARLDFLVDEQTRMKDPRYQKIAQLQSDGMSTAEIARELNMGQGEVKLILELGRVKG